MWYLLEDFMDQGWFMKLILGLGWLAVLIMFTSLTAPWVQAMFAGS